MRAEYFDCLNRPVLPEDCDLRRKKSVEKHLSRIDSNHRLKLVIREKKKKCHFALNVTLLLAKIKELLTIEWAT
jgi:hypothetical protein